jgi:hypothetical protein
MVGRGESYPVGRERLDAALRATGVANVETVYFMRGFIREWRSGCGRVMTIDFVHSSGNPGERREIRIHAVPVASTAAVSLALQQGSLERVAAWMRAAETSENVWRSSSHRLTIRWDGNALRFDES